ncbi:alpha/beta fold hydrolase [Nonomuraea endophytica]|uniref:alpha/beta fold hydrolase n=1 Tax=Nonomuraea endophytica TaxID=714136 RepID=UPI0037CAAE9F
MHIAHQVRGAGEPLVLLAGQANSHLWWESVREDFETRHTAITLGWLGTGDLFNPAANAPLLTERIPGAGMHLIRGARHAYFEEFREEAGPLVLDFLADAPG